jgi:SAM-dependent methyltransferase
MTGERLCAICGSARRRPVYRQRFVSPSSNSFHAGYDVVLCDRCGFAYANRTPDQAFLDEYYRAMAKKTALLNRREGEASIEPPSIQRLHETTADFISRHASPEDRILDIGAYTGHVLHLLKERGFHEVKGLDPSEFAARVARERYGIEVVVGSLFDELDLPRFDYVILSHVLEHIVELGDFLLRIASLLETGGRLYVEVPDAWSFFLAPPDAQEFQEEHREPFLQFSVEHLNYFSPVSLENLLVRSGFEKIALEQRVTSLAVIASVWELRQPVPDVQIGTRLEEYVSESRQRFSDVGRTVGEFVGTGRRLIVWGAGLHTQKLLAATDLAQADVVAFVDSDPAYHGALLVGRPIVSPDRIPELGLHPILISSLTYQEEIARIIAERGLPNPVVRLYPSPSAAPDGELEKPPALDRS